MQHCASSFLHRCACAQHWRSAIRARCTAAAALSCRAHLEMLPVSVLARDVAAHTQSRTHANGHSIAVSPRSSIRSPPRVHRTALRLQRPGLGPRPLLRLVKLGRHGDCGGERRRRGAATKEGEQQTRRVRTGGWGARSHGRGAGRRQRRCADGEKKKFSNGLGQVNRIKRGLTVQICVRGGKGMRGDTAIS